MRLMLRQQRNDRSDQAAESYPFQQTARFIYGIEKDGPAPGLEYERHGAAVGYIALTYGFALLLAEGRFPFGLADDAELGRFVRAGILPLLDGSAAALLGDPQACTG